MKSFSNMLRPDWDSKWRVGLHFAVIVHLLCILALLPIAFTFIYVHPSGMDDYRNAEWSSFGGQFLHYYKTNSGRYLSIALLMLNPLHWRSITGYRIACLLFFLLFTSSFYGLARTALRRYTSLPSYGAGAMAAAAVVLIITNMRGLSESFFWYTGSAVHTISAVLAAWLLQSLMSSDEKTSNGKTCWLTCLTIALAGSSELMILLFLIIFFCGWRYYRLHKPALSRLYVLLLITCIIGAIIFVGAPGNYQRLTEQHRPFHMVLPNWLYFTQKFAYEWICNPFLLAFSVLLIIVTQHNPLRKPLTNLFCAFLLPIAILYLLFLPVNLLLGTVYYPRVTNVIYVFFILGWIFFLLHLSFAIRQLLAQNNMAAIVRHALLIASSMLILISLNNHDLRNNNLFATYKGLVRGLPQRYSAELNDRYRLLQHSQDTIIVPQIVNKYDNIVYFLDITPDPAHEQNVAYAHYWGRKAVARAQNSVNTSSIRQ
jgi:hypothetical protein